MSSLSYEKASGLKGCNTFFLDASFIMRYIDEKKARATPNGPTSIIKYLNQQGTNKFFYTPLVYGEVFNRVLSSIFSEEIWQYHTTSLGIRIPASFIQPSYSKVPISFRGIGTYTNMQAYLDFLGRMPSLAEARNLYISIEKQGYSAKKTLVPFVSATHLYLKNILNEFNNSSCHDLLTSYMDQAITTSTSRGIGFLDAEHLHSALGLKCHYLLTYDGDFVDADIPAESRLSAIVKSL